MNLFIILITIVLTITRISILRIELSELWLNIYKDFAHIAIGFIAGTFILTKEYFSLGLNSFIFLCVVEVICAIITVIKKKHNALQKR